MGKFIEGYKKITMVEGSMCTQKTMKRENERQLKTTPLYYIRPLWWTMLL